MSQNVIMRIWLQFYINILIIENIFLELNTSMVNEYTNP